MRKTIEPQIKFGETNIAEIKFDPRSRDEIPKLLKGLQYIYCTPKAREKVFAILEEIIPKEVDTNNGRPGMELWKILVLGAVRLTCNWDYDKLKEIADNHRTLRQMLGHGLLDDDKTYPIQTLRDNVSLLTPEALDRINEVIVKAGHQLAAGKKKELELNVRCDSFVVETNVHFPTDISLLYDAGRKMIELTARICISANINGWRQSKHLIKKLKRLCRKIQKLNHSTSRSEQKRAERECEIRQAYQDYLTEAEMLIARTRSSLDELSRLTNEYSDDIAEIESYIRHAERQIDQIHRRKILGEIISHSEKVFSIFEPHTRWIVKGKAGILQELGLPVCVVEDQYRFILNHRVMEHETDVNLTVPLAEETLSKYRRIVSLSYDKGFYSPENRAALLEMIDSLILPKKGRLSAKDKELEYSEPFRTLRRRHSAVESAINALENHGLDRCPDHGITGFNRYVSLAIVAQNLHRIGAILQQKEQKRRKRNAA